MADQRTDALAEIKAMQAVSEALEAVDKDSQMRVLDWANDRYGDGPRPTLRRQDNGVEGGHTTVESHNVMGIRGYESSGELLAATGARSEPDRVLVMGYWYQVVNDRPDLEAQEISTELKHLGHRVSNITRAFSSLMHQKPQLVIQMRKGGNTKQARKKYKLTSEGISAVNRMLRGEYGADE